MRRPQGGFLRRVACQVLPLTRLGEGAQALDASIDWFRDWQENTNSTFWAARKGCASKWKSGSSDKKEPRLRGQHTRRRNQKEITPALLRSASGGLLPLDKDLSWKSRYRTSPLARSPAALIGHVIDPSFNHLGRKNLDKVMLGRSANPTYRGVPPRVAKISSRLSVKGW
jgi:hypothetical protein